MRVRDEFVINAVILTVVVIGTALVILGFDGIAALWAMITD